MSYILCICVVPCQKTCEAKRCGRWCQRAFFFILWIFLHLYLFLQNVKVWLSSVCCGQNQCYSCSKQNDHSIVEHLKKNTKCHKFKKIYQTKKVSDHMFLTRVCFSYRFAWYLRLSPRKKKVRKYLLSHRFITYYTTGFSFPEKFITYIGAYSRECPRIILTSKCKHW